MPQLQDWPHTLRPIVPRKRPLSADEDNEKASKQLRPITVNNPSLIQPLVGNQRQKRKDQNRAAQRAFRQRKELYVKELEAKIKAMEKEHATIVGRLSTENEQLRHSMKELENQVFAFKGGATLPYDLPTATAVATPHADDHSQGKLEPDSMLTSTPTLSARMYVDEGTRSLGAWTQPSSSAIACIRDKDGVSVYDRRREEMSPMLFQQLFSDPLFDMSDLFDESIFRPPGSLPEKDAAFDKLTSSLSQNLTSASMNPLTSDDTMISQAWNPIPPPNADFGSQ